MSSNLYEVLGLEKSASPEDIRKAYKRKALTTHPDRLGPTATEADKERANEQFRLINNAYEVLINAENRKLYDECGVWPPTAPEATYQDTRSYSRPENTFGADPFFGRSRRPFVFTDPFELFNSLFGDFHGQFANDPFFADVFPTARSSSAPSPFGASPFGASPFGALSPFSDPFFSDRPFGTSMLGPSLFGGPLLGNGNMSSTTSYSSSTRAMGQNGNWVSQSQSTKIVNGRKETIITKRDAEGNEHVTYITPEGERYTVNGEERPLPGNKSVKPPPAPPAIPAAPQASHSMPSGTSSYSIHAPSVISSRSSKESHRQRTSSNSSRHEYIDGGYDDAGHRRSSSSRRRREYAEARPQPQPQPQPQAYAQPQVYPQSQTYPQPQQTFVQPQAYSQPRTYARGQTYPPAHAYPPAQAPPHPQYHTRPGAGTSADPIYVDDQTPPPVVPGTRPTSGYTSPYPHAGEKRHRGDSDGDRNRKWWHGGHNGWFGGLLKHLKFFGHHHESATHEEHHEEH